MIQLIAGWLKDIPRELIVVIMGALPVSELRGAIPLALSFGMPALKAFWLSVAGNLIPIIPILFLLEPVSNRLRRFKVWSRYFDWLFERTRKRAKQVQRYEFLGLILFVAIPLPMTGAWTGAVAASLFKVKFRYAVAAIVLGVLIAGVIVLNICCLGINGWRAVSG
ncbi:MAG: small multi-drug export protein [Candidatus Omnitrophota bacterium]